MTSILKDALDTLRWWAESAVNKPQIVEHFDQTFVVDGDGSFRRIYPKQPDLRIPKLGTAGAVIEVCNRLFPAPDGAGIVTVGRSGIEACVNPHTLDSGAEPALTFGAPFVLRSLAGSHGVADLLGLFDQRKGKLRTGDPKAPTNEGDAAHEEDMLRAAFGSLRSVHGGETKFSVSGAFVTVETRAGGKVDASHKIPRYLWSLDVYGSTNNEVWVQYAVTIAANRDGDIRIHLAPIPGGQYEAWVNETMATLHEGLGDGWIVCEGQ